MDPSDLNRKPGELFQEADGCQCGNFPTGAAACIRITSLKGIHKDVDPSHFDTLLAIQEVTSDKVHEESFDGWENNHVRLILMTLSEILHEIYIVPDERAKKKKDIDDFRQKVLEAKDEKKAARAQKEKPDGGQASPG